MRLVEQSFSWAARRRSGALVGQEAEVLALVGLREARAQIHVVDAAGVRARAGGELGRGPAGLIEGQAVAPRVHRRGNQRRDRLLIDTHVGEAIGRGGRLGQAGHVDAHRFGQAHPGVDELGLGAGDRRFDHGRAGLGAEALDPRRFTAADPRVDQADERPLPLGRRLGELQVLLRGDQADVGEDRPVDLFGRGLARAPRGPAA